MVRRPGKGYRYGRWRGGPDPLAPPYDLGSAVDEIGDSVLGGSGVREALRELLRRGMAEVGANVLEVEHERTATRLGLGEVEVFVVLETRGPEHAEEVLARLGLAGYTVTTG